MTNNITEYILLETARENLFSRGFLLRVDFVALEQIESDTWFEKIPDNEKPVARSYIQIDIISKIMMYIEDLVILIESFIADKDFYAEFLRPSTKDLGRVIKVFFDRLENISDDDILKMMSWIDIRSVKSNYLLKEAAVKIHNYNITNIRHNLIELKDFGESNHPIYKRFKHGGMPVIPNSVQVVPKTGPLSIFETFSIVSVGNDPMHDIHIVPFSRGVLERYKKLIERIQVILLEMIDNRIASIQRNVPYVFPKTYPKELSGTKEIEYLEKEIDEYYKKKPSVFVPHKANYKTDIPNIKEKIKWYFKSY